MKRQLCGALAGAALLAFVPLAPSLAKDNDSRDEINALKAEVTTLKAEVDRLKVRLSDTDDVLAVEKLQRIYGFYADKAQWDQVADLFAKDATLEIAGRGVFVGQDHIRTYMHHLGALERGQLMNHMQLQPVVDIAPDGKTAKGRWQTLVQLGQLGKTALIGAGIYENDYVKEGGVWKIKALHYFNTYLTDFYKGWDKPGLPLAGPFADLPPDRPPSEAYEAYPGVYVPPYHYANPVSGRK